jgi:hypothetical protein
MGGMGRKSCRGLRLGVQSAAEASNIGTTGKLFSYLSFGVRAQKLAGGMQIDLHICLRLR